MKPVLFYFTISRPELPDSMLEFLFYMHLHVFFEQSKK
jgi:hypothetical protein